MSARFTEAVAYAAALHANQRRKGTEIPYLAHLLGVCSLVLEHGGTETQAIAALLHDAIEDQPRDGLTREEILQRFGAEVLAIVEACTDYTPGKPRPPWRERKERYLAHLPEMPAAARLVSIADKVHNARAILADLRSGTDVWTRFAQPPWEVVWYYRSLTAHFTMIERNPLAAELLRTVAEIERFQDRTSARPSR